MTDTTPEAAQASLDRFCATVADARLRPPAKPIDPAEAVAGQRWPTVAELAEAEPLLALPPAPYPATLEVSLTVADNARVAFRGDRYAVAPGLGAITLTGRHRFGTDTLEIITPAGVLVASHRLLARGSGATVRSPEQAAALSKAVLASFSTAKPSEPKGNYPPGEAARAEADKLVAGLGQDVVVDLAVYAAAIEYARGTNHEEVRR